MRRLRDIDATCAQHFFSQVFEIKQFRSRIAWDFAGAIFCPEFAVSSGCVRLKFIKVYYHNKAKYQKMFCVKDALVNSGVASYGALGWTNG